MKRGNRYLLYVAVAGLIVASALPGCVREDMSGADTDAAKRKYDDNVLFGASCATRAAESSTYGKQVGDILPLSNNIFDVQSSSGYPKNCGPVPFFIQQFWKQKDKSDWNEEIGMYTDWSDVIGQLAFYDDTEYEYAEYTKNTYSSYPYFSNGPRLKWHADLDDVQHIFNAWTADFEIQHTHHDDNGHSTRWVTMDEYPEGTRSSQYGTVRFFHFLRNTDDKDKLKGGEDSLCIGTTDWSGHNDRYRPSLEHFVGLTAMIGSKGNEKNPPITYQSNAQQGGGTNVSLLFQHLVCQLHVGKIRITLVDGGSNEYDDEAVAKFVMFFPKLRRYARFTTGDPDTGEGPHIIVDKDEEDRHIQLMNEQFGGYDNLLRTTFSDQQQVKDKEGKVVYPLGEYDAYTRNKGRGLAASPFSYMYMAPFDLEHDGEFEIWLMKDNIDDDKWPEIDKRYYGNLADLADRLESARKEKNHPAAPAGKEKWLLPGEKLYFNLNLSDGRATGLHVTVEGWDENIGSSGTGHGNYGIYADTEQGTSSLFEDLRDKMGWSRRDELPPMYGDDHRLEFHDHVFTDHSSETTLHVPPGCTLDGLGNVLYVHSDKDNPWRRSGAQGKGGDDVGTICNLFVVQTDAEDISDAAEKGTTFSYFNSEGKLIGHDGEGGEGGPFKTMEELIDYLNENDCW